jgi:hypothetical protein
MKKLFYLSLALLLLTKVSATEICPRLTLQETQPSGLNCNPYGEIIIKVDGLADGVYNHNFYYDTLDNKAVAFGNATVVSGVLKLSVLPGVYRNIRFSEDSVCGNIGDVTIQGAPQPLLFDIPKFCSLENKTLKDVVVLGSEVVWYKESDLINPIIDLNIPLVEGDKYSFKSGCLLVPYTVEVDKVEKPKVIVDCTLGKGKAKISITNPIQGYTYSLDEGSFQTSSEFTDVPNGSHVITAKSNNDCTIQTETFDISCVFNPEECNTPAPFEGKPYTLQIDTCHLYSPTIEDLSMDKNIIWYDSENSNLALSPNTIVVDGATYYVSQIIDGCESKQRTAVEVMISVYVWDIFPMPFCNSIENKTLADINPYVAWFKTPSNEFPLPKSTPLVEGETYYIAGGKCFYPYDINIDKPVKPIVTAECSSELGINVIKVENPLSDYVYSLNDGPFQASSVFSNISNNSYVITAKSIYSGCSAQSDVIEVVCNNLSISENELNTLNTTFSPNPTQGKITFAEKVDELKVFDLSGRLVKTISVNTAEVDLSDLQNGVYMMQVSQGQKTFNSKVVKE